MRNLRNLVKTSALLSSCIIALYVASATAQAGGFRGRGTRGGAYGGMSGRGSYHGGMSGRGLMRGTPRDRGGFGNPQGINNHRSTTSMGRGHDPSGRSDMQKGTTSNRNGRGNLSGSHLPERSRVLQHKPDQTQRQPNTNQAQRQPNTSQAQRQPNTSQAQRQHKSSHAHNQHNSGTTPGGPRPRHRRHHDHNGHSGHHHDYDGQTDLMIATGDLVGGFFPVPSYDLIAGPVVLEPTQVLLPVMEPSVGGGYPVSPGPSNTIVVNNSVAPTSGPADVSPTTGSSADPAGTPSPTAYGAADTSAGQGSVARVEKDSGQT
jgi:hypothetical protein